MRLQSVHLNVNRVVFWQYLPLAASRVSEIAGCDRPPDRYTEIKDRFSPRTGLTLVNSNN